MIQIFMKCNEASSSSTKNVKEKESENKINAKWNEGRYRKINSKWNAIAKGLTEKYCQLKENWMAMMIVYHLVAILEEEKIARYARDEKKMK